MSVQTVLLSLVTFVFVSGCASGTVLGAIARPLPARPTGEAPGSADYPYASYQTISETVAGRTGTLYLPAGPQTPASTPAAPFTTFAFGHGYTVPEFAYAATFKQLARKGIAVIYVPYDINSSDVDYDRMARDYNHYVAGVIAKHPGVLSADRVVFSGHSTGASIAAMASGLPPQEMSIQPTELLTFAVAGMHPTYYTALNPNMPCALVVGQDDTENPAAFTKSVYDVMTCRKEMIILSGYHDGFDHELSATHSSIRTFGWLGPQISDLHYYGYWKFMIGAALDAAAGGQATNSLLFGADAGDTGDSRLHNQIIPLAN